MAADVKRLFGAALPGGGRARLAAVANVAVLGDAQASGARDLPAGQIAVDGC